MNADSTTAEITCRRHAVSQNTAITSTAAACDAVTA